jgi:hypothetical protein
MGFPRATRRRGRALWPRSLPRPSCPSQPPSLAGDGRGWGHSAELSVSVPQRGLPPRGRSGTVCSARSCKSLPTSRHLLPQPCARTSLCTPRVMREVLAHTYLAHARCVRARSARSQSARVHSPHAPCLVCFATVRHKPPPPATFSWLRARAYGTRRVACAT